MIYTQRRLNGVIKRIKKILLNNDYPKNVINNKKIAEFSSLKRFGTEKFPVYLRILWIGKPSTSLEKEIKTVVEGCYGSVNTHLVFTLKRMLSVARKDVLPTTQKSSVIYEYKCHSDSRYVERISTATRSHQATCSAMVNTSFTENFLHLILRRGRFRLRSCFANFAFLALVSELLACCIELDAPLSTVIS